MARRRSASNPIGPTTNPSESVLGPVESVLKVQAADSFEVCSGLVWTQAGP